tara:strand:- start:4330 stop:4827 length:498 start_codon:yes stop_codon:yes gene_type:complete
MASPTKYSLLLERVVIHLSNVDSEIGQIHRYERVVDNKDAFLNMFRMPEKDNRGRYPIRGWTISRTQTPGEPSAFGELQRTYMFILRGYWGLEDGAASELAFQDIVERVMDAFDDERDLQGQAEQYGVGPTSLDSFELRQFGSALAHYAEISLPVIVTRNISYAA